MNITIAGAGYVGLATAVLLAKSHNVTALDVSEDTVNAINRKACPLKEKELCKRLMHEELDLKGTVNPSEAYKDCDIAIIAVPTNYDETINKFDTSILESAVRCAIELSECTIVIKSTAPIGFTKQQNEIYKTDRIIFAPEFLREGNAYHDVSNPSRIVVGVDGNQKRAIEFTELMMGASENNPPVLITGTTEAETVKLFANTYLAMRIAFFNELDMFADNHGLNTKDIINGICLDDRIGTGYNNPSFGFGGYCLPKDTKQLAAQSNSPLLKTIPTSNDERIKDIANKAAAKTDGRIGIYGISMKSGSDNARASSSIRVAEELKKLGKDVVIFESRISADFEDIEVTDDIREFAESVDLILANRKPTSSNYDLIKDKLYTRDCFGYG